MTISKVGKFVLRKPAPALTIVALAALAGLLTQAHNRTGARNPIAVSPMAAYGAEAVTIDRNARDYKLPDQIEWKGRPGSASQTAILLGDPAKPGLYVQLLKRGPDDWSQPHSHPNDRILTVLSGTMLIGTGAKFDRHNTVALGPGSVVRDIANQMHFDGTGPEGMTIEIVGMGPSTRTEAK